MLRRLLISTGTTSPISSSTWSSVTKGAEVTLSSGSRTATKSSEGWQSVLGSRGRSAGRYQFELSVVVGSELASPLMGIADMSNTSAVLATYLGNSGANCKESVAYWASKPRIYRNLSTGVAETAGTVTFYSGSMLIAIDLESTPPVVRWYQGATLAGSVVLPAGKIWYPAASVQNGAMATLRTADLVNPVPGYSEWG